MALFPFDIRSVLALSSLASLACGLLMLTYWLTLRTYQGFGHWSFSLLLGGAALGLMSLRDMVEPSFSITLALSLVVAMAMVRVEGFRLFEHGICQRRHMFLTIALALPLFAYFTLIDDNILVRNSLITLIILFCLGKSLYLLWSRPRRDPRSIYPVVMVVLTSMMFLIALRAGVWLLTPSERGLLATSFLNSGYFVFTAVQEVAMALCFIMLNSQRLTLDLEASQQRLQRRTEDLHDEVQIETERRLAQERLLTHNARLAATGEMIGTIAHQWRQPLSALAMVIQRLALLHSRQQLTAPAMQEAKESGMSHIRHMSQTIDDFLRFYSPDRAPELFSPYDQLKAAIRLVQPLFDADGIRILFTGTDAQTVRLNGYPNQFTHACLNLLANARDAIGSRRQNNAEIEGCIAIEIGQKDKMICLTVTDNGCGVPDSLNQSLFEPYSTSKEEGSGIGLYMTRTLVEERFKGTLLFESRPGRTSFMIRIPLALEESSA